MKPDQEMHMAVEEPELEPCDLFVDIGLLIIEGRTPLSNSRGYGEGPHCVPPVPSCVHQKVHICDLQNAQCAQQESFRKHMLLLWKNNIPMSIEVLLCPECCHSDEKLGEATAGPEPSFVLLEQWTVQMISRRLHEVSIVPRALMQAVRSYLHFSQLSAWYSRAGGRDPKNVVYRICVPGEVFSNKFSKCPEEHVFPLANVGWNNSLKVGVRAMPRCDSIPRVSCPLHDVAQVKAIPQATTSKSVMVADGGHIALKEKDRHCKQQLYQTRQRYLLPKGLDGPVQNEASVSDHMWGDSLLDPPQCLEMYPKRYQSPSRSGSPVMETPEHWMFGGHGLRGRAPTRDASVVDKGIVPRERGRPFRRVEKCDVSTSGHGQESSYEKSREPGDVDCLLSEIIRDGNSSKQFRSRTKQQQKLCSTPEETMQLLKHMRRFGDGMLPSKFSHMAAKIQKMNDDEFDALLFSSDEAESVVANLNNIILRTKLDSAASIHDFSKLSKSSSHSSRGKTRFKTRGNLPASPLLLDALRKHESNSSSGCSDDQKSEDLRHVSYSYNVQKCPRRQTKLDSCISDNDICKSPFVDGRDSIRSDTAEEESDLHGKGATTLHASEMDILTERLSTMYINSGEKLSLENCLRDSFNASPSSNIYCGLEPFGKRDCNVDEEYIGGVLQCHSRKEVPTAVDKAKFRRSLDSAASLVFHSRTGLPLTSSPAPVRKGTRFDFDSTLTSVAAIKHALFDKDDIVTEEDEVEAIEQKKLSTSAPPSIVNSSNLLGNFEESVLNGRLEPVSTVEGFTAEIGASGSFCPRHIVRPVTVFFYTLSDVDKVSTPYLGHINLGKKGYHVPKNGTIQVTLFNPHGTVVKMFVVMYDLRDMPSNCQTFLRQRTLYMPVDASDEDPEARKWLRYLIHLRFASSKSGRIYLHTDVRMVIFRKSDMDAATIHGKVTYELRSFTRGPTMPRFSPRR